MNMKISDDSSHSLKFNDDSNDIDFEGFEGVEKTNYFDIFKNSTKNCAVKLSNSSKNSDDEEAPQLLYTSLTKPSNDNRPKKFLKLIPTDRLSVNNNVDCDNDPKNFIKLKRITHNSGSSAKNCPIIYSKITSRPSPPKIPEKVDLIDLSDSNSSTTLSGSDEGASSLFASDSETSSICEVSPETDPLGSEDAELCDSEPTSSPSANEAGDSALMDPLEFISCDMTDASSDVSKEKHTSTLHYQLNAEVRIVLSKLCPWDVTNDFCELHGLSRLTGLRVRRQFAHSSHPAPAPPSAPPPVSKPAPLVHAKNNQLTPAYVNDSYVNKVYRPIACAPPRPISRVPRFYGTPGVSSSEEALRNQGRTSPVGDPFTHSLFGPIINRDDSGPSMPKVKIKDVHTINEEIFQRRSSPHPVIENMEEDPLEILPCDIASSFSTAHLNNNFTTVPHDNKTTSYYSPTVNTAAGATPIRPPQIVLPILVPASSKSSNPGAAPQAATIILSSQNQQTMLISSSNRNHQLAPTKDPASAANNGLSFIVPTIGDQPSLVSSFPRPFIGNSSSSTSSPIAFEDDHSFGIWVQNLSRTVKQCQKQTHNIYDAHMSSLVEILRILLKYNYPQNPMSIFNAAYQILSSRSCCLVHVLSFLRKSGWIKRVDLRFSHFDSVFPNFSELPIPVQPSGAGDVNGGFNENYKDLYVLKRFMFLVDKTSRNVFFPLPPQCSPKESEYTDKISVVVVISIKYGLGPGLIVFPRSVISKNCIDSGGIDEIIKHNWAFSCHQKGGLTHSMMVEFLNDQVVPFISSSEAHSSYFGYDWWWSMKLDGLSKRFSSMNTFNLHVYMSKALDPFDICIGTTLNRMWGIILRRFSNETGLLLEKDFPRFIIESIRRMCEPARLQAWCRVSGLLPMNKQKANAFADSVGGLGV